MTVLYSAWFSSLWCISLLSLPAIPFILFVAVTSEDVSVRITASTVAFAMAVYVVYTEFVPTIKHQIRAGVFPFSLLDPMPETEDEFIKACREAHRRNHGLNPSIVSHGWGFYLRKMRAPGYRVWTLKYTGKNDDGSWKSGTTIKEVKRSLAQDGWTLSENPSMEYASLGSWIASVSHGHPGIETDNNSGTPLDWLSTARVLWISEGEIFEEGPVELLQRFGSTYLGNCPWVVLDVKLRLVRNITVERFARSLKSSNDCEWWIKGTHIRIMFIGAFGALGVVWNRVPKGQKTDDKHWHPHRCASFCFWLTADVFSFFSCSWIGNVKRFEGYAKLSDANSSINPTFHPLLSIWPQLCTVYNCELLVSLSLSDDLHMLVQKITQFHRNNGGRTELRTDGSVVFFDISARSKKTFLLYFKMLRTLGVEKAAQHLGKFRFPPEELGGLHQAYVVQVFRPVRSA